MVIVLFSEMAAVCHLGFVMSVFGNTDEGHLVVFITEQNLVGMDTVVLIICMFFYFTSFARKRLFMPPKLFFFGGDLTPKWGGISTKPPKGTSLGRKTSYDA